MASRTTQSNLFLKSGVFTILILCFLFGSLYAVQSNEEGFNEGRAEAIAAFESLNSDYPNVQAYKMNNRITRLYGRAFSFGNSPEESAEEFRINHAGVLNARADELLPMSLLDNKAHTVPLMYNPATDDYKFTLVYYSQYRDDVPVFQGELRLLVRNEADYPVVLAVSSLRELGDFSASDKSSVDFDLARNAIKSDMPELTEFTEPQTIVWAGINDKDVRPTLAVTMTGFNDFPQEWLYVIDAETNEILYKEDLIIFEDVYGSVNGMATVGMKSEQCEEEVSMGMPYAQVNLGTTVAYCDDRGAFMIPHFGSDPVNVTSEIKGPYFEVFNYLGSESVITQSVTPPGPTAFLHNPTNTEYERAQVNAYIQASIELDMVLSFNPSYPTLSTQSAFPIYVNRTDGYCPGNAWYSPSEVSMNFCASGSGYPNTAWQSVLYHEFGHYMVDMAGSGQGQYGEGAGDIMSIIVADDPRLGLGFYGDCNTAMRNANNSYQYPCSGAIHDCGQLISGCFWSTRNEMIVTHPVTYMDTLANLFINSILLHTGDMITPQITIDWLTLDDDDANLDNGTPHHSEICAGFSAHNMDCPELSAIYFDFPNGIPEIAAPNQTTIIDVTVNSSGAAPISGTGQLYYSIDGAAFQLGTMAETTPNNYEAELPAADCNSRIDWYVAADAEGMGTITDPSNAPASYYSAMVATGIDIVFEDNFQTSQGWTVSGSVADGAWNRGTPVGGGDRGDPPTDFDGSGACYLTDNVDDNSDVDDGTTTLISPTIDLSSGDALIHYARWYSNNFGADPNNDEMHIYISNNNGTDWTLVETVGPVNQANGGWYENTFMASDFVTPTAQVRLRFDASDLGDGSVVEAAVDDFQVKQYVCNTGQPVIATETINDWTVNIPMSEQLSASGGVGLLTWSDKLGQLVGTGLTLSSAGLLDGTPTSNGLITFTAKVEDEELNFDEEIFSFTINAELNVTTASLPAWTVGQPYNASLQSDGGTSPVQWSDKYADLSGTGLNLGTDGNITGSALSDGVLGFTAMAVDFAGASDETALSITINPVVSITTVSLPEGKAGTAYSEQLTSTGGTSTVNWSDKYDDLSGTGLTLSTAGLLSGTPLAEGTINFTAMASDIAESTDEVALSFEVGPAFICGDVNGNEAVDIIDITHLIAFLYMDGPPPAVMESADVNNDSAVNVLDATHLINFLYKDGPELTCP